MLIICKNDRTRLVRCSAVQPLTLPLAAHATRDRSRVSAVARTEHLAFPQPDIRNQARSLLPVRASCFWIAFSTAGLLLDCFQLRSLAFGLLSALPACFWIAFSTCGLDWIWIVSLIGNLRKDCSRKLEVFPLRTEPRGHVFLAVHMQATRLCTITPQQSWPPRIVAPR